MTADQIKAQLKNIFECIEKCTGPMPNAYIAGGAIASLVLDEPVRDYDFWFENPEDFNAAANAIKSKFPFQESKYAVSFDLEFINFHTGGSFNSNIKIQLVQSRMGPPEVLTKKFDYKHTHSYYTRAGELVYDEGFIKLKELVYVKGKL